MRSLQEVRKEWPYVYTIDDDVLGKTSDDGFARRLERHSQSFTVVASWGEGWDHVSISLARRCPSWDEMEWIKKIFFKDDELVMQLHVPTGKHINVHPNCLHLWRPQDQEIPIPPLWMV